MESFLQRTIGDVKVDREQTREDAEDTHAEEEVIESPQSPELVGHIQVQSEVISGLGGK